MGRDETNSRTQPRFYERNHCLVERRADYSAADSHEVNRKLLNSPHGLHRYWLEDVLTATDAYAEATLERNEEN